MGKLQKCESYHLWIYHLKFDYSQTAPKVMTFKNCDYFMKLKI